jgi:hypothetical protein
MERSLSNAVSEVEMKRSNEENVFLSLRFYELLWLLERAGNSNNLGWGFYTDSSVRYPMIFQPSAYSESRFEPFICV